MRNDTVKSHNFTRRAIVLGGGKLLLVSTLVARLYQLQIIEADRYTTMSEGNRIRILPALPRRGKMLDRQGRVMAEGQRRYQVVYESTGSKEADAILKKAAELLELDFNSTQALMKKLSKLRFGETLIVEDFAEWESVTKVEVNAVDLPGIRVNTPEVRHYPFASVAANITGYTGIPNEKEAENNALYRHPDFRIGKAGVEVKLEERLQGKPGIRQVEVNARGAYVRELNVERDIPGEDITLTIDMALQQHAVEHLSGKGGLKHEGGAAVVMDVRTGGVLALASVPNYDPNQFVRGIKQDYWNSLMQNPDKPLLNKALNPYPPGSTFKPITGLAGLHYGECNEHTTFFCPGHYEFGGRRFHCWQRHGHGTVNLAQALMVSCNVYFFNLARRVGIDRLATMARQFGFGDITGIELPAEKAGIIADSAWKERTFGKQWYAGETLSIAIGQGYTLATPLQLALMTARIAGGGKALTPSLLAGGGSQEMEMVLMDNGEKLLLPPVSSKFEELAVSPQHLAIIRKGMGWVVNGERGTAQRIKTNDPDYMIAGKTGTSQVISNSFKDIPAERSQRYHALFIGFAPIHDPRYSVAVVVEHGGFGSSVAAPIGRELLMKARELENKSA